MHNVKAIICSSFGPPENLKFGDTALPQLASHQLSIKIYSCSINFPDTLMIQGKYQNKQSPPFIPGMNISGQVVDCGTQISKFKPGDKIMAIIPHGGLAEYVHIDENLCFLTTS